MDKSESEHHLKVIADSVKANTETLKIIAKSTEENGKAIAVISKTVATLADTINSFKTMFKVLIFNDIIFAGVILFIILKLY